MRRLLAVAALLLTASCGSTDVTQPTPVAGAPTSAGSAMCEEEVACESHDYRLVLTRQ
jgi:hypothetical protein